VANCGWKVDRQRALLGQGEELFFRAKSAIDGWQMFPKGMAEVFGNASPLPGLTVSVLYRAWLFPVWLLMPARVVYVIDDTIDAPAWRIRRFGFAYGTLPEHPECGEERFLVEWNQRTGEVWYELVAVSRPRHWLARLGYPYTRYEQVRFRRQSALAMQRAAG
jgi:uncharacterized protein (UPF0548 family)